MEIGIGFLGLYGSTLLNQDPPPQKTSIGNYTGPLQEASVQLGQKAIGLEDAEFRGFRASRLSFEKKGRGLGFRAQGLGFRV